MTYKRVDPPNCGCTDCLTGYSIPLNRWPDVDHKKFMRALYKGEIQNASGATITREVKYTWSFE